MAARRKNVSRGTAKSNASSRRKKVKKKDKPGERMPPWTPFQPSSYSDDAQALLELTGNRIRYSFINSRYQVDLEPFEHPTLGSMVKVGIKDHWRTPRHDWRDFQRIKNE